MPRLTGTAKKSGTPKEHRHLTDDVKEFIVRELARFRTTKQVIQSVKEVFDVEVTNHTVLRYNPKSPMCIVGKELLELFDQERAAYISDLRDVPGYHMKHRLVILQEMADKAREEGNKALAANFVEQMAKEVGGMFTNRRLVDLGGGDKPVQMEVQQVLKDMPEETLIALASLSDKLNPSPE